MMRESCVSKSKLRLVHVQAGDQEADVVCCALGIRKVADRGFELLIYGKDKEAVTRVPIKPISRQQDNPIEMSSERKDDRGVVRLSFLGKHEATIEVTDPDQY